MAFTAEERIAQKARDDILAIKRGECIPTIVSTYGGFGQVDGEVAEKKANLIRIQGLTRTR